MLGLDAVLHEDIDCLLLQPGRPLGLEAGPVEATQPIDLAALDGEQDVRRALVAADDVELSARRILVEGGVIAGRAARCAGANHGLLLLRVLEGLHLRHGAGDADSCAAVGGGEIFEFVGIEEVLRPIVKQRADDDAGEERADDRAILGREAKQGGRSRAAASARHIAGDHIGIARQEAAKMLADVASIDVITAARIRADDEIHLLAGVIISGADGRRRPCGQAKQQGRGLQGFR